MRVLLPAGARRLRSGCPDAGFIARWRANWHAAHDWSKRPESHSHAGAWERGIFLGTPGEEGNQASPGSYFTKGSNLLPPNVRHEPEGCVFIRIAVGGHGQDEGDRLPGQGRQVDVDAGDLPVVDLMPFAQGVHRRTALAVVELKDHVAVLITCQAADIGDEAVALFDLDARELAADPAVVISIRLCPQGRFVLTAVLQRGVAQAH